MTEDATWTQSGREAGGWPSSASVTSRMRISRWSVRKGVRCPCSGLVSRAAENRCVTHGWIGRPLVPLCPLPAQTDDLIFFCLLPLSSLFRPWDSPGGRKPPGPLVSPHSRHATSRFVYDCARASTGHRLDVFGSLLYGASYTCTWKYTVSALPL